MLAAAFQALFNTEVVRYTLYTGEPAFTGFMRTRPHATFWGWVYAFLYFLQNGWPAWAGAAAGAFFFLGAGRAATPGEAGLVYLIGLGAYGVCVLFLLFGGKRIEHTLEILNWVMVTGIFSSLAVLGILFARRADWAVGAARPRGLRPGRGRLPLRSARRRLLPDRRLRRLLGLRGRHEHHALQLGARQGLRHGRCRRLHPDGGRRPGGASRPHGQRLRDDGRTRSQRWRGWWRIVAIDQWAIFFVGALVGMALPGILYTAVIPRGTDLRGLNIASELARALVARGGPALAVVVAIMSAWILFKVQLDILEATVRSLTDILWSASRKVRAVADVRRVYYAVLATVVLWGAFALTLTQPIVLLQIAANVAGFVMALASLHILRVNTTLLPKPLRPALWRRVGLVLMAVFYGSFVWLWTMGGLVPDPARGFLFRLWR